jgi:Tol biopolymer transport system component
MVRLSLGVVLGVMIATAGTTPAGASFPGKNGRIAYSTAPEAGKKPAQIYTMSAAGKQRRRLTGEGWSRNPAWSHDGTRIAFDRAPKKGDMRALFVMKADGSRVRRVPARGVQAYNPSWSANGRKLVFEGCRGTDPCEESAIFVVGIRGKGLKRIAGNGTDPVWAPNGNWIAYRGKLADADECSTLLRVKPSGRQRQAVLPRKRDPHDVCSWGGTGADFSPDSRRLVYYGLHPAGSEEFPNPIGGTFEVWKYDPAMYTVGIDGKNRKLVASRSLESTEWFLPPFAWSPDGRKLLWRDDRGTYRGNPDGSGDHRISASGGQFAWQARRGG